MASLALQHRRTHNLLLISKLLDQRDGVSPFTLVLDGLEQSGRPLVAEYMKRAHISKTLTIFISFETLRKPENVDVWVEAWGQDLRALQNEVATHIQSNRTRKTLLVIDGLNGLASSGSENIPAFLSSFLGPDTSLLGAYHVDVPLSSIASGHDEYSPALLTILQYLATTIIKTYSFPHVLSRKAARERSVAEPSFGLQEGIDGILHGLGANSREGLVFEMEHRRKSGRGVQETFFLPIRPSLPMDKIGPKPKESVILLEDHPLYRVQQQSEPSDVSFGEDNTGSTFDLGLTEKQKRDRENVVLPYFDAQKGSGQGGRILYDMGEEDDFDEEEDEI